MSINFEPTPTAEDFRLLTIRETADRLGVSGQVVYRATYNAGLPTVRIGKAVRIRERDLLAWLDSRTEVAA